jgi:hypothetical protein
MRTASKIVLIRTVVTAAVVLSGAITAATQQSSQTADDNPVLGTWTLNLAKSQFSPGPAPKSQIRQYDLDGTAVKTTVTTTFADGTSTTVRYTSMTDGIEYPITGSATVDAITLRRTNALTAEAQLTHAGKTIGTARRVISADGRSMTITYRDESGEINNVSVYDRQKH